VKVDSISNEIKAHRISLFPMYGLKILGIEIVPSLFWKFSKIAAIVLPIARPEPLRV